MKYFFIGLMVLVANSASALISLEFVDYNVDDRAYKVTKIKNNATLADAKKDLKSDILTPPSHIVLLVDGKEHPDHTLLSTLMKNGSVRLVFLREHPEVKAALLWLSEQLNQVKSGSFFLEILGKIENLKKNLYSKRRASPPRVFE